MNKLKKFSAYAITFLVLAIGLTSLISFYESSPNSPFSFISIIGSMIVFFPAFDYWFELVKRILKIKD